MILGDRKQIFDLICHGDKIKYSQEEKVGVTIASKPNFTSSVKKLTKKANKRLPLLTRGRHYMDIVLNELIFSSFV